MTLVTKCVIGNLSINSKARLYKLHECNQGCHVHAQQSGVPHTHVHTHTHNTHIQTLQTKAISRNQSHAGGIWKQWKLKWLKIEIEKLKLKIEPGILS